MRMASLTTRTKSKSLSLRRTEQALSHSLCLQGMDARGKDGHKREGWTQEGRMDTRGKDGHKREGWTQEGRIDVRRKS